jgi:hypothetical protein
MTTRGANLEIGIGGDLRGLPLPKDNTFAQYLDAIRAAVRRMDPAATIDFLEGWAPPEICKVALEMGSPYRQFTDLYVVGGGRGQPDALERLKHNLTEAGRSGTITSLNMQVWGTSTEPTIERLVEFYHQAYALAKPYGVGIFTETHIDRFTYDPRRLLAVHERLLTESRGEYGINVGADFSHYVHQLGNPHGANWTDLRSGALRMDPSDGGNVVSTRIIQAGLIGYGHLRCAAPNELPRASGSIQYPLVDPASDPDAPGKQVTLRIGGRWDEARTRPWKEFYRQTFAYQLAHPERRVARFSTEFIECEDEYKMDDYGNLHQNVAALCWAQRQKRELLAGETRAAKA